MTTTLQMIFRNEEGRSVTVSLVDPRDDLEADDVETVMNNILQRNIFHSSGGDISGLSRAQLISREVETLIEF